MEFYKGKRLTVHYSGDDPDADMQAAVARIPKSTEESRRKIITRLVARLTYLADEGQLRFPDHMNTEAELPDRKNFYAVKSGDLRAYGWFGDGQRGGFIISHFVYKTKKKLDDADTAIVTENWRRWQEN